MNDALIEYVTSSLESGVSPDELKKVLVDRGWPEFEVEQALHRGAPESPAELVPKPEEQSSGEYVDPFGPNRSGTFDKGTGIEKRHPIAVGLLFLLTFGVYAIYWLVTTSYELRDNSQSAPNPKKLFFLLVPVVGLIVWYMYLWSYCKAIKDLTGYSNGKLFLLWIFLSPVAVVVSQLELNKKAYKGEAHA